MMMAPGQGKKAFLGRGWAFPLAAGDGDVAMRSEDALIDQSIRIILGSNPGERVMRPTFGAGLRDFVFEPISTTTLEALRQRVRDALIDWEPRIDVDKVTVTADPADPGKVVIDVSYRVRATNTQRNLVYPFFLEEGVTS